MGMDPTQLQQQPDLNFVPPPEMAGVTVPEPAIDPTPVMAEILSSIQRFLGRETELNADVLANTVNTLASAYATLAKTMTEQGGLSPQDELALETQRLQVELDIKQQEFELKKAEKMLDMQIKSQMAEQEARQKNELHQQNITSANVKTALQVQESEARQTQAAQRSGESS